MKFPGRNSTIQLFSGGKFSKSFFRGALGWGWGGGGRGGGVDAGHY